MSSATLVPCGRSSAKRTRDPDSAAHSIGPGPQTPDGPHERLQLLPVLVFIGRIDDMLGKLHQGHFFGFRFCLERLYALRVCVRGKLKKQLTPTHLFADTSFRNVDDTKHSRFKRRILDELKVSQDVLDF